MRKEKRFTRIGVCFLLPWPWLWAVGALSLLRAIAGHRSGGRISRRKLALSGAVFIAAGITFIGYAGMNPFDLPRVFWSGALSAAYGAGLAAYGLLHKPEEDRYTRYESIIGERKAMRIEEIASALPVRYERAMRDLRAMIERGLFAEGAYIDDRSKRLVLDPVGAVEVESEPAPAARGEAPPPSASAEYRDRIIEIRALNAMIDDEAVSREIDRIEALTASIFRAVEDDPTKETQIHKFMSYYLPTTLKLLRQYGALERQSLGGENVSKTKRDIEGVLHKVAFGFESQLDQLYRSDAMDVNADIAVLETMMAKDGLTRNEYAFRQKEAEGGDRRDA